MYHYHLFQKINAKNAFEVPLVHLNETSDYNSTDDHI